MDKEDPTLFCVENTSAHRDEFIERLKGMAARKKARIEFVYEASYLGFGLWNQLQDAGINAHVLASTKIPTCPHQRRNKTDAKDALKLFELLRGHVLAANKLPAVKVQVRSLHC